MPSGAEPGAGTSVRLLRIVDLCRDAYQFSEHDQAALAQHTAERSIYSSMDCRLYLLNTSLDCTQIHFCT
jgi:hypothetical protein